MTNFFSTNIEVPETPENLHEKAKEILLLRYKDNPTINLSNQIVKHCPEEKWRVTIYEIPASEYSTKIIGKVIGKKGQNLKDIGQRTNTIIYFDKENKSFVIKTKKNQNKFKYGKNLENNGIENHNFQNNLWFAVDLLMENLKDEEGELTDWEKYYAWFYHYNFLAKDN